MKYSVVIASIRSLALVSESVARARPQCEAMGAELIVARLATPQPESEAAFAGCRVVRCPPGSTLPMVRGAGLAAAVGDWVFLGEDNCIPHPQWLERMVAATESGAVVVGGTMDNAHPASPVDAASFYAEYGFFGRARTTPGDGASPFVTGANVGYHRSVVGDAAAWALEGEWEGVIHHRLANRGAQIGLARDAVMAQNTRTDLRQFCVDRFGHGRTYASVRCLGWNTGRRLIAAAATPLLPVILTRRAWQHAGRLEPANFVSALPYTLAFFSAWAVGEAAGYLLIPDR